MAHRIIQGDVFDLLPTLEPGSVDAVVTDPPYGQTNEDYDSPVAFSPDVWRECFRVARSNAALLSFAGNPTYHRIASAIEAAGWKVRQMWGWVYRNGFITSAWPTEGFDRLAPAMDPIVFATKGKILLNLKREGVMWRRDANSRGDASFSTRTSSHGKTEAEGRWPRLLVTEDAPGFEYFMLSPNSGAIRSERTDHPNQKPLALMRWLLSKLPPGGTVLDPFAGSGTTGVACLAEGRDCILIEKESEYVEIARKRLLNEGGGLFAPVDEPLPVEEVGLFDAVEE